MTEDDRWMSRALELAQAAAGIDEVPVGAIVVLDGECIGEGANAVIRDHDPTAHAEIVALRQAARRIGNYRLVGATVYVTLEPCAMCAGALVHARVRKVVYGARDPKAGAAGSVFHVFNAPENSHRPLIHAGVQGKACAEQLRQFFQVRRRGEK